MNAIAQPLEVGPLGTDAPDFRSDPLWLRLQAFALDDAGAIVPYSLRLARENGWSRHHTGRVITEYRKFCYMAMTSGTPVSPSDQVDQAWHLHLLYTRNYWEQFCREVLCRPFHHQPSRGGPEERHTFQELYAKTLVTYHRVFGISAPEDIWPLAVERYETNPAYCRIDVNANWIIPKPNWR